MNLYHRCGSRVYVEITNYKVLAQIGVSVKDKVLKPTNLQVNFIRTSTKEEIKKLKFICERHGEISVENSNDLLVDCRYCGDYHPISIMYVPMESGGVYCKNHLKRFKEDKEEVKTVEEILKSYTLVLI
jgi:hypothetical protein